MIGTKMYPVTQTSIMSENKDITVDQTAQARASQTPAHKVRVYNRILHGQEA